MSKPDQVDQVKKLSTLRIAEKNLRALIGEQAEKIDRDLLDSKVSSIRECAAVVLTNIQGLKLARESLANNLLEQHDLMKDLGLRRE